MQNLRPRFAAVETRWQEYLESLGDGDLEQDFEFTAGPNSYRWNIEGQIVQLVGHAFYHRGQVAMLVDELEGTTINTDYLFWAVDRDPRYGIIEPKSD